jgi:hypothetical protein
MIINYVIIRPLALSNMTSPDDAIGKAIALHPEVLDPITHAPDMAAVMPYAIPEISAPNIHIVYLVGLVIAVVAFILLILFYKNPAKEQSAVAIEKSPFNEAIKFIIKRRPIALLLCFFCFTFVSNIFTTYNVDFFTLSSDAGGLGLDSGTAGLIAVMASAFGVFAPVFGVISDRIHPNRKYVLLVFSAVCYTIAAIFGFKAWGPVFLVFYVAFTVLAMASANATIRPSMPMLVKEGGVSSVTLGLAAITFLEFFGQIFTVFVGMVKDAFATTDPVTHTITYGGYAETAWVVAIPAGILFVCFALLTKPGKKDLLLESKHPEIKHPESSAH